MSLGPNARRLLDEAESQYEPRPTDAERIMRKLAPKLAGAAVATAGATIATKSAAASAAGGKVVAVGLGTKVVAAVALASAVGMGAMQYADVRATSAVPPPSVPVATAAPAPKAPAKPFAPAAFPKEEKRDEDKPVEIENVIVESPAPVKPAPTTAGPKAADAAPVVTPPPTAAAPAPASTLGDELQLLKKSEVQLRAGDAQGALATLDEHAARHPNGTLTEERMAARVFALCALGRVPEAKSSADALLSAHPSSPHAARVRASCITK